MLGGKLPGDKPSGWKKPGATHKARFMAFCLLVLKIFAFSEQQVVKDHCLSDVAEVEVEEGKQKKTNMRTNDTNNKPEKKKKFLIFNQELSALSYYIPMFFTFSWGCDAPSNDLQLYKELLAFKNIDDTLATAAPATLD